jgi:FPC/CPF motif-containing protein YcgG
MFFADITKMSTGSLQGMHRAIQDRLSEEDASPPNAEKPYGVRQYSDWRDQADEIEAELDGRGEVYSKIAW